MRSPVVSGTLLALLFRSAPFPDGGQPSVISIRQGFVRVISCRSKPKAPAGVFESAFYCIRLTKVNRISEIRIHLKKKSFTPFFNGVKLSQTPTNMCFPTLSICAKVTLSPDSCKHKKRKPHSGHIMQPCGVLLLLRCFYLIAAVTASTICPRLIPWACAASSRRCRVSGLTLTVMLTRRSSFALRPAPVLTPPLLISQ